MLKKIISISLFFCLLLLSFTCSFASQSYSNNENTTPSSFQSSGLDASRIVEQMNLTTEQMSKINSDINKMKNIGLYNFDLKDIRISNNDIYYTI